MSKMNWSHWTDEMMKHAYAATANSRVKTGRYKGHITRRALRFAKELEDEAVRRGHKYPCTWLSGGLNT